VWSLYGSQRLLDEVLLGQCNVLRVTVFVPVSYHRSIMKLDVNALRYLSNEEFRTLQAVELGQKNVSALS
jgi:hypothetical protein